MAVQTIPNDVYVTGNLSVGGTFTPSSGSVDDDKVAAAAAIDPQKVTQQYIATSHFGLEIDDTVTGTIEFPVWFATAAQTVQAVFAVMEDSGTSTDIDFDLFKYTASTGATILSAPINIVHGTGDGTKVDGSISSATLASGDMLTCKMTVTSATGALGPLMVVAITGGTIY